MARRHCIEASILAVALAAAASVFALPAFANTTSIEGTGALYAQALNNGNVEEYYGNDRYETAAKEAAAAYGDNGSTSVIVANGDSWADSLSATALAGALDAPIVLTESKALPDATSEEIANLKEASGSTDFKIIIVGGEGVVSSDVQVELAKLVASEGTVTRLSGADRYATQLAVYDYGVKAKAWGDTVILTTGENFADALSISPLAYSQKMPVFLVPDTGTLTSAQTEAILAGGFTKAIIVGGTSAVPQKMETFLKALLMRNGATTDDCVSRISGADRYDTSAAIATWSVDHKYLSWNNAAFATGSNAADALGGSALQGKSGSVLLLTADEVGTTATTLATHKSVVNLIRFFGGGSAISGTTREAICALFSFDYVDMDAYTIMGPSTVTVQQMVDLYNQQGLTYDTFKVSGYDKPLKSGGAASIEDFCGILLEEANAESVRAEVVFAQCMVETGWLQYGGAVKPDMYNFAGIGAIDSDPVNCAYAYKNVRWGLRAQVQHLKAYATTDNMAQDEPTATNIKNGFIKDGSRIDILDSLGYRGTITTVQELSGTWASGNDYHSSIMGIIQTLKGY